MAIRNNAFYIILDLIGVFAAFLTASLVRPFGDVSNVLIFLMAYALVIFFYQARPFITKRDNYRELHIVFVNNVYMAFLVLMFWYLFEINDRLAKAFYISFFVSNFFYMYLGRLLYKKLYRKYYQKKENKKKLLVCANDSNALKVMHKLSQSKPEEYEIVALTVLREDGYNGDGEDGDLKGKGFHFHNKKKTGGYQEAAAALEPGAELDELGEQLYGQVNVLQYGPNGTYMTTYDGPVEDYLKKFAIDDVLISVPDSSREFINSFIVYLESMGITVHLTVDTFGLKEKEKKVEELGVYHVLTYCPRVFEPIELFLKRAMDIVGGLVGILLTGIISIFLVPAIKLESPGPVVFKQTRVGRNGRRFSIYKFRSMYIDAEERKKELMKHNEMNGLMFKMKDDPRITKVGKFIRKTSLDEFPQFFNVLKGDMSLVGTRPPTIDEFLQYDEHHKRRLSLKPGITGMWQVSGRSDIQDFEEVVKLDVEYIDNWSIWLDIKILIQTVISVLKHEGAE